MKVLKGRSIKLNGRFSRPCLRVFFAVLSTWTKYIILGIYPWYIGGARRSTAMWLRERWHRSPFPMFSRLGEVIRDVQETSSEIWKRWPEIQTSFCDSWNILKHLCLLRCFPVCPTFIAVVAGSHSKCRQRGTALGPQRVCGANLAAGPVLVGSGRSS